MNNLSLKYLLFLSFAFLIVSSGCHSSRYIPDDKKLYTGTEIIIDGINNKRERKRIQSELENLVRPRPNTTFLWFYFGLWAHKNNQREKSGKIAAYLNRRYGEKPIFMDDMQPERAIGFMNNRLENRGYFASKIVYQERIKRKKGEYVFNVTVSEPYTIENYTFLGDTTILSTHLAQAITRGLIKKGSKYDLDILRQERVRISDYLKFRGYYFFDPDYLIFRVDTNQYDDRRLNLYLSVKQATPQEALYPYTIKNLTVYSDYRINPDATPDTLFLNQTRYIYNEDLFIPKYLDKHILFAPGQLYNHRVSNLTVSRLSSLGNFRFVNIRHLPLPVDTHITDNSRSLESFIYLTPANKQAIRFELQALSKSNNFVGPLATVNYRNRNAGRGGENLLLSARFGFETQFAAGELTGLNSYEVGVQGTYIFPRLILPFTIKPGNRGIVSRTKIDLNYSILNRVQFYRLNSFLASFGYVWSGSSLVSHEVHPVSINFVNLSRVSETFEEILNNNPFLRRSFEEQFIPGFNYTFQYNELLREQQKSRLFARFNLDISGNTLSGVQGLLGQQGPKRIFNQVYAQYTKVDLDVRKYFKVGTESTLVTRIFGGIGYSYGNSSTLPFIKQYFAGGPNSLRAFRIRSLGPGIYASEETGFASFFDQSGDIKLEANIEWRFPMVSFLKGAFFIDAGNIWLLRENEATPGGKFTSDWYKQIAVGAGLGLRLDITFFVIRLDIGTPLHSPFLDEGQRWINEFRLSEKNWRRDNVIYNLAIGYPF